MLDEYRRTEATVCDNLAQVPFFGDSLTSLCMIHVNIRSIYKNYENFLVFLESTGKKFDIIVMSETHIINSKCDFNIPGYSIFWNESMLNKFDGCVIYAKAEIFQECHIIKANNVKCLKVTVSKCDRTVDVLGFYRSHLINPNDFINNLAVVLKESVIDPKRLYIYIGDINLDILDASSDTVNNYMSLLHRYGFSSMINAPTRVQGNSATCIDHLFVKCKSELYNEIRSVILTRDFTDHYPVLLNIGLKGKSFVPKKNEIQKIDYVQLENLLSQLEWSNILVNSDVESCTLEFVTVLQNVMETCTHNCKISCKNLRLRPWITQGLLTSIRKRDKLKKQCTLNPNNIEILNSYKNYRNNLTKLIRKTKYQYYKTKIQSCNNDLKKTWKIVKEATNDITGNCDIKKIVDENDRTLTDPALIADEFNNYFSKVGQRLASKIKKSRPNYIERAGTNLNSFYFTPLTENELILQIKTLKNNRASGDDLITSEVIKHNHKHLLKPLLHIVNSIFIGGIYPSVLKKTNIVPIFKQGNRELTTNYRPIALTSTLSKLVEKCIKLRLQSFIESNNLFSKNQFAFRTNACTENALCRVTEAIVSNLDRGSRVLGIFLDLAKAFDTVAHHILLERLDDMGIRGIANNLIRSFLHKRSQKVKVRNCLSSSVLVEYGVPQGTVLGPFLFNVYINGILSILDDGEVFCFADDTVVLIVGETWETTVKRAEVAITKIKCWLDNSLLSLNIDKTKFLAFALSGRTLPDFQKLKIHRVDCEPEMGVCDCSEMERARYIKYLGIYIDECLKWTKHLEYVTTKIRKVIYKFYELRNILAFKLLKTIYFSLVESLINYGIIVWGSACKNVLNSLDVAQKYIIKIIMFKTKRYSSQLLFQESNLLNVEQLYIKAVIRFMLNNDYYRNVIAHTLCTRQATSQNLSLASVRHVAAKRHVSFTGPRVYNALPTDLRGRPFGRIRTKVNDWIVSEKISLDF